MKILLLQSPLGRPEPPVLPLGLAWLAGGLVEHEVQLVDPNVHGERAALDALVRMRPDVVGVSLRNVDTTQVKDPYCFFRAFPPFIRSIRRIVGSDVPIVVGGPGFSLFARPVMERVPELDFGVHLEGEITFPRLLNNLDAPHTVPGVLYRDGEEVRFTGDGPRTELGSIHPRLDLVDIDAYRPYIRNYSIGVQTLRGCVLRCAYCTYVVLSGASIRRRSVSDVLDELSWYAARGIDQVFFADAVFNIPLDHAAGIAEGILSRGLELRWRGYHNERQLDPAYMKLAVRSGCTEFAFSPDAWAPRTLKLLQKNIRPEDIQHSLDMVERTPGARANYNFFVGLPGQDLDELKSILRFWVRSRRRLGRRLQSFRLSYVRVEPHTPLHRTLVEEGRMSAENPLLPETDREVARLFHRNTGNLGMDLFCRLSRVHRWPLSRRLIPQAGDAWRGSSRWRPDVAAAR